MKSLMLVKKLFKSFIAFFKGDYRSKSGVKYGYDKNGMPYIDMSDPQTAQVFKKKLEAFENIKTVK
jgi:hypothetical protein